MERAPLSNEVIFARRRLARRSDAARLAEPATGTAGSGQLKVT
jgi:hypothetical protein